MFSKKKCLICGTKNPKERTTCASCGASFASREVKVQLAKVETKIKRQFSTGIDPEKLRLAINQVIFAASSDSSDPVLTGVMAEFEGYKLTLAATDELRLAEHRTSLAEPVAEKVTVIIPAVDLQELSRDLVRTRGMVDIEGNLRANQVVFRTSGKLVTPQLVKGTYPDYSQHLPRWYDTRASFLISKLLKIMSDFPPTESKAGQIVRLQVVPAGGSGNGKIMVAILGKTNSLTTAEITAEVEGKENRIAFNRLHLTQGLGVISEEKATLDLINPLSLGIIRPVGAENFMYVLMPKFVKW